MQKGHQKSCFLVQKRGLSATGSMDCAIFVNFGRFQESLFFCCRSGRPKIMKNPSVGRCLCRTSDAAIAKVVVPGGEKGGLSEIYDRR